MPPVVRDVLGTFLSAASSHEDGGLVEQRRLREQELWRLKSLAESQIAGSAWQRLRKVGDDKLRPFAWEACFWATNAALAAVARHNIPQTDLYRRALHGARRIGKGKNRRRPDARADELAARIVGTPIPYADLATGALMLRQGVASIKSSPLPLEAFWPEQWKSDPKLTLASAADITMALAEFLGQVHAVYDHLIASIPPISYPLRHDSQERIYTLALARAASEHLGSPYDEAITELVSAAFGGIGAIDTTRKRRQRAKPSR